MHPSNNEQGRPVFISDNSKGKPKEGQGFFRPVVPAFAAGQGSFPALAQAECARALQTRKRNDCHAPGFARSMLVIIE
jgi:hypothetical protein